MLRVVSLVTAISLVVAAAASAAGWPTHRSAAGGFTIAAPASWVDFTKATPQALKVAEANPALRPYLTLVRTQKLMKLLLVDSTSQTLRNRFATNLNVIQLPTPLALGDLRRLEVAQLERAHVLVGRVNATYARLPAGQALRLAYQARFGSTAPVVAITQFILVRRGVESVITYTTLPNASAAYQSTFAASAGTLRFG